MSEDYKQCDVDICQSDLPATIIVDEVTDDLSFRRQICEQCAGLLNVHDGGSLHEHSTNRAILEDFWCSDHRYCSACGNSIDTRQPHIVVNDKDNYTPVCDKQCRDQLLEHRYGDSVNDPFD